MHWSLRATRLLGPYVCPWAPSLQSTSTSCGPLPCCSIYAVEKNPNAVVTLQNRAIADGWEGTVTIVPADMREWDAPEQADVLVRWAGWAGWGRAGWAERAGWGRVGRCRGRVEAEGFQVCRIICLCSCAPGAQHLSMRPPSTYVPPPPPTHPSALAASCLGALETTSCRQSAWTGRSAF